MKDNVLANLDKEIKKQAKSRDMYKIIFTDLNGKDIEYEILATFRNTKTKRIYYILTDHTRTDKNELKITAYYIDYQDEDNEISTFDNNFYPVEEDDELKMVMDVFNKIKENL